MMEGILAEVQNDWICVSEKNILEWKFGRWLQQGEIREREVIGGHCT